MDLKDLGCRSKKYSLSTKEYESQSSCWGVIFYAKPRWTTLSLLSNCITRSFQVKICLKSWMAIAGLEPGSLWICNKTADYCPPCICFTMFPSAFYGNWTIIVKFKRLRSSTYVWVHSTEVRLTRMSSCVFVCASLQSLELGILSSVAHITSWRSPPTLSVTRGFNFRLRMITNGSGTRNWRFLLDIRQQRNEIPKIEAVLIKLVSPQAAQLGFHF